MHKVAIVCTLSTTVMLAAGCATKSYVRHQVQPLINKVNELDERTAENTKQISSTDARLQQGTETLNSGIERADQNARDAGTRAEQAQETASSAQTKTASLEEMVDKGHSYHLVSQVAVQFAFGEAHLDSKAKEELDQFSAQLSTTQNYLLVVEGRTDGAGSDTYNDDLSERRAEQVVRYLVSKHDVKPFKVHAIGLGKAKPVASNDTVGGRRANRRADVALVSNIATSTQGNTANQPGSDDEMGLADPPRR
jgi:outer membrane protein OmpA-like peptidoglycan-associated protein